MKVIICGGRDYSDWYSFRILMDLLHEKTPITHVIQGGARGADSLAARWANEANVPQTCVPAKWETYGRKAGWIRNNAMADLKPDAVIAFPGGRGTAMMIDIAKRRGIKVIEP